MPGVIVAWLAFIVGAWLYPPAELTGKKDSNGYPTPAHAGEAKAIRKYRFWSDLKWRMFSPNPDWMPGWPVFASTAFALVAAAVCAYFDQIMPWVSAFVAYVLVEQVAASRRRNSPMGEPCPGTRFGSVRKLPDDLLGFAWRFAAGAVGGAATLWTLGYAFTLIPKLNYEMPGILGYLLFALAGGLTAIGSWWSNLSIGHWRVVVKAREEWKPRWEMLKQGDGAPHLVDRQEVGPFIIDTFDAPGGVGAAFFYQMAPKIVPAIGTNTQVFILPVENVDGDGQPIPNSQHPLRFRIVTTTSDGMPDMTDATLDAEIAKMAFEVAVVGGAIEMGAGAPVIGAVHLITDMSEPEVPEAGTADKDAQTDDDLEEMLKDFPPEVAEQIRAEHAERDAAAAPQPVSPSGPAPATWMVEIQFPFGPDLKWCHTDLEGFVSGRLGVDVCFEHRNYLHMFAGVLDDPEQPLIDARQIAQPRADVDVIEAVRRIREEDTWIDRWTNVLKTNVNFPVVEHSLRKQFELRDGTKIESQTFVTLRGDDVAGTYFGLEEKLKTSLEHIPFVATTGYLHRSSRRGERHPQAFDVIWSEGPIPANPDKLTPPMRPTGAMPAQHAVLRGRVNEAFKAARLAQPEVYDVQCLTGPRSRGNIWKIKVRLYGGVTLAEVRGAQQKIKQAWASDWLRVTESPTGDGIIIIAGANPKRVTPVDETVMPELVSLDWEQAWLDANMRGVGGVTPKLTKVDVLPDNQKVQVLDFTLPSGLSIEEVRQAKKRLMATTSNAFIDIRPNPDNNPAHIRLLACEESPMPYPVSYDFEYTDTLDKVIPFATGIEGRPITIDVKDNAHLMLLGLSGSGKSVSAQNLMYGALVQGFDVAVIDIQKQGADFKFAEDRCVAFARNVPEALATMEAVYAEVKRRAEISGRVGAGHVREWDTPPPPMVVFIDEFKGVLMAGKKPSTKPEDNPDIEKARLEAMQTYESKKRIGFLTGRLAAEARSADVHIFLMTQKLVAADLDDEVKDLRTNLARILLGKASNGDRMSALRDPFNAPDIGEYIPKGRGLYESVEDLAEVIQFWYAPTDEYRANLIERVPEVTNDRRLDIEEYLPKPIELDDVAFSVVSKGPSLVPTVASDDIVLKSLELGLEDLDEGEEYDLSALGIEIVGDDDDGEVDGDTAADDGEELDWGDDFTPAADPEQELDWGDFPALDTNGDEVPDFPALDTSAAGDEVPDYPALNVAPANDEPVETPVEDEPLPEPDWSSLANDLTEFETGPVGQWALEDLVDVNEDDSTGDSAYGWIVADRLLEVLSESPGVAKVVANDPDLHDEILPGVRKVDVLTDVAAECGVMFLLLAPPRIPDLPGITTPVAAPAAPQATTPVSAPAASPAPAPVVIPETGQVIIPVAPPDPSKVTEDF
ncbi:FtsK/SpoIIIE domain-containing protein [Aeromicrobium sp. 179-A 4D2 NHS]|uniref:FtsK/SpoIIIE domain-containing protein n=1 Tax=Aeromicrobium sp. 179-A 4D2 NHS TaxID=3142375 RepID=UPI00399F973B